MPLRLHCPHVCSSTPETDDPQDEHGRGHWVGKLDFVLSCIGYGVGIGDLIRFPYLFIKNGGGAFLIPFLIFLALCGFPLFYLEVSLGQFSSQSCTTAWKISPLFKGVGWSMLIVSAILSIYYVMMIVWTMNYFIMSFQSVVPWSTCNNTWNTKFCVRDESSKVRYNSSEEAMLFAKTMSTRNLTNLSDTKWYSDYDGNGSLVNIEHLAKTFMPKTAAEEYWERAVLGLSGGLHEFGGIQWKLCLCLFLTWLLVVLCLIKGIRTSGRVVYITVLVPYFLLTVFLIRGATLPGAGAGVLYFLSPQWEKLLHIQVWLEAAIQVFFSLGPAWGGLITMASYNRFHHKCFRDAVITTFADGATGLYSGLVISCVLGFMAHKSGVHVSKVVTTGPGLALVAYPEAISYLPIPQLWAVLFFITLIFLGLDSQFGMFESVCSGIADEFPHIFHNKKIHLTISLAVVGFLLGIPFTTQGGMYLYQIIDWYATTFAVLFIGFLECVIIGIIYGAGFYSVDLELMTGKRPSYFIRICWTIVTPILLLTCLISLITNYDSPKYGGYTYPQWSITLGYILSVSSLIPIPLMALNYVINSHGSIRKRLMDAFHPDMSWGPLSSHYRQLYHKVVYTRADYTWRQRVFGWRVPGLDPTIFGRNSMDSLREMVGLQVQNRVVPADEVAIVE